MDKDSVTLGVLNGNATVPDTIFKKHLKMYA
jgi:hypothetical protein